MTFDLALSPKTKIALRRHALLLVRITRRLVLPEKPRSQEMEETMVVTLMANLVSLLPKTSLFVILMTSLMSGVEHVDGPLLILPSFMKLGQTSPCHCQE
jgi:hypothetical protein